MVRSSSTLLKKAVRSPWDQRSLSRRVSRDSTKLFYRIINIWSRQEVWLNSWCWVPERKRIGSFCGVKTNGQKRFGKATSGSKLSSLTQGFRLNVNVQEQVTTLTKNIQEFNREASKSQKDLLKAAENDFQAVLREAQKKQNAKDLKRASRPAWMAKLQSGLSTFCETAHHYQGVLDVLNEQAPEYTSAIWGAIKILLMASVNSEKLKQRTHTHLQELGRLFGIMRVFVDLQPSERLVQFVIAAYGEFIRFLEEAVKFYTQRSPSTQHVLLDFTHAR